MDRDRNIDKYIKLSDQLVYLYHHKESFIKKFGAPADIDPDIVIDNEVKKMILNIQDDVDHDDIAKVLIENNKEDLLQKILTQDVGWANIEGIDFDDQNFSKKQLEYEKSLKLVLTAYNKEQYIIALLMKSIIMQEYDIAFETVREFLADLLQIPYLAAFEVLADHFKTDLSKYEVKIALLQRLKPFMKKHQAEKIMKVFEEVLGEPAENSIFRQNINPLRVGLTLYKLIDDIQTTFGYSQYTSQFMKNKIEDQLKSIMEVYKDPNEIIDLMENQDIDGHSSFFYMQKYSLYHILDSKIMDKFIYDKWRGREAFNSTILGYS